MRAYVPEYELKVPRNFTETLKLLSAEPGVWTPFAGGTDLMVVFETGRLAKKKFLSLWNLPELQGIEATTKHVDLGALTTYTELQGDAVLRAEFPLLCRAASETGAVAIQNRGTIGGNIANASPAADSPPALLVYEAELELVSASGSRWVPYVSFHTGYKTTVLRPDELIRRVRLKRATTGLKQYYRKAGTRKAQAISKVCLAAVAKLDGSTIKEARIALGSVAPTAVRLRKTEAGLAGRTLDAALLKDARAWLASELSPIDDIRSTAQFRARVAGNLLEDFLCGIGCPS